MQDNKGPVLSTHTELGIEASQLSSLLTIETGGVCASAFVCVCAAPPANTRVKHKAIQLSTWPKG